MKRTIGFSLSLAATILLSFCGGASAQGLAKIEGTVRDSHGQPLAGARVFLEAGLEGPLAVTQTSASGAFNFSGVLPGFVGVFAYAPGHAVDGHSVSLALDATERLDIVLPDPGTLAGTVQDEKGQPIAGARITRVALQGSSKVGIPLAKLAEQGLAVPATDARGMFTVALLPEGAEVAVKVAHPQYAQAAPILRVGRRDARITLTRGVLVTGTVAARGRDATVPNATLFFKNADPPRDTVVTHSQADGSYAVRLTPGPWLYSASGPAFSTANSQRVLISPDYPNQRVALQVAGTAALRGSVRDAKSGNAVAGARVVLVSSGVAVAKAVTGPAGAYELTATEGETVVQLESAPGYLLPPEPAMRVIVQSGKATDVPAFWVAPLPKYSLEVIDSAEAPVAGAIVRVLFPEQFGWYATDADGLVELAFASLQANGTVVGMVEDQAGPNAAIFAITRDRSTDAIVQLMPLTSLTGTVVNEKKSGVPGLFVEARTTLEGLGQPVTLWRTFSAKDGAVRWPAVVPRTPLACFASTMPAAGAPAVTGESAALIPVPEAVADVGLISVPGARDGRSALGRKYAWYKHNVLCGALPADAEHRPAILVHASAAQAGMMADGLAQAQRLLQRPGLVFAVVVSEDTPCADAAVPVLRGEAPSGAYTFVVNANAEVVLECIGLPPVVAINAVAPRS
jgi:hypothetical protein